MSFWLSIAIILTLALLAMACYILWQNHDLLVGVTALLNHLINDFTKK